MTTGNEQERPIDESGLDRPSLPPPLDPGLADAPPTEQHEAAAERGQSAGQRRPEHDARVLGLVLALLLFLTEVVWIVGVGVLVYWVVNRLV